MNGKVNAWPAHFERKKCKSNNFITFVRFKHHKTVTLILIFLINFMYSLAIVSVVSLGSRRDRPVDDKRLKLLLLLFCHYSVAGNAERICGGDYE